MKALLLLAGSLLAGCAGNFGSPYSWDTAQANRQNLAASAERPRDLVAGRFLPGGDGAVAANAIERFRAGRARPLPGLQTTALPAPGDTAAPALPAVPDGGTGPVPAPASP